MFDSIHSSAHSKLNHYDNGKAKLTFEYVHCNNSLKIESRLSVIFCEKIINKQLSIKWDI